MRLRFIAALLGALVLALGPATAYWQSRAQIVIGPVAISVVAIGSNYDTGGYTTKGVVTSAPAPIGSTIVVTGGCVGRSISSISDSTNTYSSRVSRSSDYLGLSVFYTATPLAAQLNSGSTISITYSGACATEGYASIFYITGLSASSGDVAVSGTAVSAAPSLTSGALSQANEIVIGAIAQYNSSGFNTYTEATGYTMISKSASFGSDGVVLNAAYKTVSATTAVTYNPTPNGVPGAAGAMEIATFKTP